MRAQPAHVGLLPSHQIGIKTNNPFSSVMWVTVDCHFLIIDGIVAARGSQWPFTQKEM